MTGAFWCMCVTLSVHVLCVHGFNVKNRENLNTSLKKFPIYHVKKKSDVLAFEKIKEGLTVLFDESNRKDLLIIMGKHCWVHVDRSKSNYF